MDKNNASNFIKTIIAEDLKAGRVDQVVTRFPPEPNGYLHIGHARAITISFELADEFGGRTNLRFDDTNPVKEDVEFVKSIQEDISWLGFEWDGLFFASDYFGEMYERALLLIKKGLAYVDDQSAEQIRETRGTLTSPGQESPYRNRSVEENLDLFARMRAGEFKDGERVLRAKIDMASPNINMRDPVLFRIAHVHHHNTGDEWCIYPMYAYAHPLEDAIEGVTHSLCSLEFEDQRPFYDWVIRETEMPHVSRQYEFGKMNIAGTIMGKRHIKRLVESGVLDGWDDPRVYTISGMRRRGFTPEGIRSFIRETGVSKSNGIVDPRMLEHFIREDLKLKAPRTMAVLRPLKVIITNYPEGQEEWLDAENNSEVPEMGVRQIPFSREIYIEQDDFMENPPPKYHRLFPGNEVRLKHAYFIKCEKFIKDETGQVVELHCTYDPETKSGTGFTGRKVKGTIHWVEASHAVPAEFRLYDTLLAQKTDEDDEAAEELDNLAGVEDLEGMDDIDEQSDGDGSNSEEGQPGLFAGINPKSLEIVEGFVEPGMKEVVGQDKFQFFRHGYFNVDEKTTSPEKPVFNLTVSLKSSFKV